MPGAAQQPLAALRIACRSTRHSKAVRLQYVSRRWSSQYNRAARQLSWSDTATVVAAVGVGIGCWSLAFQELHAEAPPAQVEIQIEKPKTSENLSKEDNRDLLSSQHLQVKSSWENPGVYAWGSNAGRVAAPDLDETVIKVPRRISYFDGKVLRDLKMGQFFGAAIDDRGDLLQWGTDYSPESREPTATLKGKDLRSLAVSSDRILALSSNGSVYSIPVSKEDQASGNKPSESTWIPFWYSSSPVSYRTIVPQLSWFEKIAAIEAGRSHALLLTSNGRVFSAAASSTSFPSAGELGVPGLTWTNRPPGPYDMPHELSTLRGFNIKEMACGDNHSIVLDTAGRVFTFGDNSAGQLGFEPTAEVPFVDAPSLVPTNQLYAGTSQTAAVTSIAAGGTNTFFMIDATRVTSSMDPMNPQFTASNTPTRNPILGRISSDVWSCGSGILGSLGNGRWTHRQGTPVKVKTLSGLFEYDEKIGSIAPIRIANLSIGATHASAVMANVTYLGSKSNTSNHDTNWGADVLFWGGNEHYQLGTGRRNNVNLPAYIGPLDGPGVDGTKRDEHRFHITPMTRVKVGGKSINMEQRVDCGRYVTAVYSAA